MAALVREGFERRNARCAVGCQDWLQVGARGLCDPAKRRALAWGGVSEDFARVGPCKTLDNANGELYIYEPTKPLAVRSAPSKTSAMPYIPGILEGEVGKPQCAKS